MGQDQLAFLGNEAGRRAAVATVEKLTGVRIDHFAEVNLAGAVLPGALAASRPQAPATIIPAAGPQGGALIARDGIPCVN
jgi:hypothetical protein